MNVVNLSKLAQLIDWHGVGFRVFATWNSVCFAAGRWPDVPTNPIEVLP